MNQVWKTKIEELAQSHPVLVCMRGTPDSPRCGFSARVVNILKLLKQSFVYLDMDSDRELWETLREMNQWRTSPQIFIHGQFVGGCDVLTDLYNEGELKSLLDSPQATISSESPSS
jgi:monothiol glutaredoxin